MPLFTLTDNKSISYAYRFSTEGRPDNYPEEVEGSYWIDTGKNVIVDNFSLPCKKYEMKMSILDGEVTDESYYIFLYSAFYINPDHNTDPVFISSRVAFLGKLTSEIPSIEVTISKDKDINEFEENNQIPIECVIPLFIKSSDCAETEDLMGPCGEYPTQSELDKLPLNKYFYTKAQFVLNEEGEPADIICNFENETPQETLYNVNFLAYGYGLDAHYNGPFGGGPTITLNNPYIQISCSTSQSQIYYTDDNSNPTSSSNLYSSIFQTEDGNIIKAIATKEGWDDSNIAILDTATSTISTEYSPEIIRQSENNKTLIEDSNKNIS